MAKATPQKERLEALGLMALHNGSRDKASELTGISKNTLSCWAYNTHADTYRRIRQEVKDRLKEEAAELYSRRAVEALELTHKIGEKLNHNLDEIPARDLPGAYRNTATVAGISTDKAAVLRGEATAVVEHRSLAEVKRSLAAKGVKVEVIEGEAKQIEVESGA